MSFIGMPNYTPENQAIGKNGGYAFDFSALHTLTLTDEEHKILEELDAFWRT
jgi:hypothetical protein